MVFQSPGDSMKGPNVNAIRVMEPTDAYPNGYIRIYNSLGQPVTLEA